MKKSIKKKAAPRKARVKLPKKGVKLTPTAARVLESKIKKNTKKAEKINAPHSFNPYAPGSWSVDYIYDAKTGYSQAKFFKLTAKERAKNRERILSIPLTHEETVEEAQEKMKLKK